MENVLQEPVIKTFQREVKARKVTNYLHQTNMLQFEVESLAWRKTYLVM